MYDLICYNTDDNIIDKLWQWDSDRIIIVKDIETTENTVFHFGNRKNKTTLKVTPTINEDNNLEVKIPNCLLRQPYPIQIYVYEGTAEDDDAEGQTICMTQIPVRERPEPDSIEYEDIEDHIDYLKELIERTETLEANLSNSIEDAEDSIENLSSKIEEFATEADSLINRINNEINTLNTELSNIISDANTAKETLQTEINNTIENANTSVATFKETFQAEIDNIIEDTNASKENIVSEINGVISNANDVKEVLQTKITESSELLISLQEENVRAEENIKTLQDENVSVIEEFVLNGETLPIENRSVSVNLPFLEAVDFVFVEDNVTTTEVND